MTRKRPPREGEGRPTKYRKKYCKQLIEHMEKGYSIESFAADLNVSKNTVYEWVKKHAEFADAKKIGEVKSLKFWEKLGIAGAWGKVPNFNAASYIFNMKNRFSWRDTPKEETEKQDSNFTINLSYDPEK